MLYTKVFQNMQFEQVLSDSNIRDICKEVCKYFGFEQPGFIQLCEKAVQIYNIPSDISVRALIKLIYNGTMFIKYADKIEFYFRLDENISVGNLETCKIQFSRTNDNEPIDLIADVRIKPISFSFANTSSEKKVNHEVKHEIQAYKEPVDMSKNIYYIHDNFTGVDYFYDENILAVGDLVAKMDLLSCEYIEKYNTKLCLKFFNKNNTNSHYVLVSATKKDTIVLCIYNTWYAFVKMYGIAHIVDIIMSTSDPCKVAGTFNAMMKKISISPKADTVSDCVSRMMNLLKDEEEQCELLCTYLTDYNNEKINHLRRTYKQF